MGVRYKVIKTRLPRQHTCACCGHTWKPRRVKYAKGCPNCGKRNWWIPRGHRRPTGKQPSRAKIEERRATHVPLG